MAENDSTGKDPTVFWTNRGRRGGKPPFPPKGRTNRGGNSRQGKNPVDSRGKIMTCNICGSRNHFARKCPDADQEPPAKRQNHDDKDAEEVHGPSFLTFAGLTKSLVSECYGKAILDTACATSVTGLHWFEKLIGDLKQMDKQSIVRYSSNTQIVFGDGSKIKSMFAAEIPVEIGGFNCRIKTEVIPGFIPFLLSVKSMTKIGCVLDLKNSKILIPDVDVSTQLEVLSTGHIAVNVEAKKENVPVVHSFITLTNDRTKILKLHRQFGHCSAAKLQDLIKAAGNSSKEILGTVQSVCDECDICQRYGRKSSKPAVSLPLANAFNEVVAIDLHELTTLGRGTYYMHVIDLFTRFSQATLIFNKRAETIVNAFNRCWNFVFGAPRQVFTDNGREFDNCIFTENAEMFNINILTTATYSPWSNGCCERHNMMITETFLKTCESSPDTPRDLCLQQAVLAKNLTFQVSLHTSLFMGSYPISQYTLLISHPLSTIRHQSLS